MAIQLQNERGLGERISVVIYRIVAILWIMKGLLGAADLFGFPLLSIGTDAANVERDRVFSALFAGLDMVAGVSLWLSIGWGAVIWFIVSAFYSFAVLYVAPGWHSVLSALFVILLLLIHSGYRITLRKDAFIERLKRS